jgi:hypothetical protein
MYTACLSHTLGYTTFCCHICCLARCAWVLYTSRADEADERAVRWCVSQQLLLRGGVCYNSVLPAWAAQEGESTAVLCRDMHGPYRWQAVSHDNCAFLLHNGMY